LELQNGFLFFLSWMSCKIVSFLVVRLNLEQCSAANVRSTFAVRSVSTKYQVGDVPSAVEMLPRKHELVPRAGV
jgi:hypothetical protein